MLKTNRVWLPVSKSLADSKSKQIVNNLRKRGWETLTVAEAQRSGGGVNRWQCWQMRLAMEIRQGQRRGA